MKPYDALPRFHDPRPAPIPRQSGWSIVAAVIIGLIMLGGTAVFLAVAQIGFP